jgi:hypothetical protein
MDLNYDRDDDSDDDSEDDSETYDSDDERELIYEPLERSPTRFNIVLCELYNEKIHGIPYGSNIIYHFLTINRYKKLNMNILNDVSEYINLEYLCYDNKEHNIFRNYENIVTCENYIKPEIAECIYLPCGGCVSIIKTFWIKIIQRKWKKIFREQQNLHKKMSNIQALLFREIHGKWPDSCKTPTIRGMLQIL